jgi:WD40 repeat protein
MNTPGFEASMTVREEPQRNANGAYLCATCSPPQSTYVDTLAVSSTGWVVFAGFGSNVELWSPATGQQRSIAAARPTSNLVLGPDGASVIFGTAGGGIEFWDLTAEQRIRSLKFPGT